MSVVKGTFSSVNISPSENTSTFEVYGLFASWIIYVIYFCKIKPHFGFIICLYSPVLDSYMFWFQRYLYEEKRYSTSFVSLILRFHSVDHSFLSIPNQDHLSSDYPKHRSRRCFVAAIYQIRFSPKMMVHFYISMNEPFVVNVVNGRN